MLKKLVAAVAMAAVGILANIGIASADNPATAQITFRCTVTLSVSLLNGASSYHFGDVAANSVLVSSDPITVRNDSTGAICNWELNVDNASLGGWTLGNAPGLDTFALSGLFRKTDDPAAGLFNVNNDTLSVVATDYNETNYSVDGLAAGQEYKADGFNGIASSILPQSYATTQGLSADRNLWLKLETPIAVTDQNQRTINLIITAKLNS